MRIWKGIALLGLMAATLVSLTDDAMAQRRRGGAPAAHGGFKPYLELSATYGSMWGGNLDLYYNFKYWKIRTGTGPSIGLALDYNIHPMQSIELSYTRQDGSIDLDYQGITTLAPMSVNFWQIGSLRKLAPGRIQPFVLGSLGVTYFSPEQANVELGNQTLYTQSATQFSMTFGVGFKAYFGEAEKVGIRASFKVMPSMYNTGAGLYFGTGGGGATISGEAIWQWEVAGGLTVKFGT